MSDAMFCQQQCRYLLGTVVWYMCDIGLIVFNKVYRVVFLSRWCKGVLWRHLIIIPYTLFSDNITASMWPKTTSHFHSLSLSQLFFFVSIYLQNLCHGTTYFLSCKVLRQQRAWTEKHYLGECIEVWRKTVSWNISRMFQLLNHCLYVAIPHRCLNTQPVSSVAYHHHSYFAQ